MTPKKILLLTFAVFCLAPCIHAQQAATATLSGTVSDQHGAVGSGVSQIV